MRYVFTLPALLMASIFANAQHTIVTSESEFGKHTLFEDSKSPRMTLKSADGKVVELRGEPGYSYSKIDECRIQVKYKSFLAYTDTPEKGIEDEMLLQIGTIKTKYYSTLLHSFDSLMQAQASPDVHNLLAHANPVFFHNVLYTDLATSETNFVCRFATEDYEYSERPPTIDWTLSGESKDILGYTCAKATGSFRGRTYEAWFTEEIPVSAGPWKLRGLPGTILSARDSEGLCVFEAISVQKGEGVIERPEYLYFKISRDKYYSMLKQYFNAPLRFTSMHMSRAPGIVITPPAKETPFPSVVQLER